MTMWNLIFAIDDITQAMLEFSASWKSIKSRYHPLVWLILSILGDRS